MSQIHVRTLLEAMDACDGDIHALSEKTGYSIAKVFDYIIEARRTGHIIRAAWHPDSMTTFSHIKECACGKQDG